MMTNEEYQEEINRRDEIIDSYKGIQLDVTFLNTKLSVIHTIIDSSATESEKLKMIRALIIYS